MSVVHDNALIGSSVQQGYKISRSVRLRSNASAYLNRTFTTPTDGKKFTISFWLKRGILGNSGQTILWGNNPWTFALNSVTGTQGSYPSDTLLLWNYGTNTAFASITAAPVLRDPSAWYHIMLVADTAQATASNRILMYVNGVNYPTTVSIAQNTALSSAIGHVIGRIEPAATYSDAYITEYNFIDGQALTPSSFGSTNTTTGVWQPKKYTGTYGTNGFYLNFSDNSAATAAAIGKDYSGNGNNWTPNNISVTAGVTYDSMTDVPTLNSATAANYATLNPLVTGGGTISNANLGWTGGAGSTYVHSGFGMASSKWYCEMTVAAVGSTIGLGIYSASAIGTVNGTKSRGYLSSGVKYSNGSTSAYGATFTTGDVIAMAVDVDAGTLEFYKNNVSQGVAFSDIASDLWFVTIQGGISPAANINFGQRPFSYTPPSGYKALNTYNLPSSTITNGGKYMAATLYTGNGSTQSITNAGSFKPDLVWMKSRSTTWENVLEDSVRGATKVLSSNLTQAEYTSATSLTAFNSNGFSLGADNNINQSGQTYVGWQWQAGQGSTSSNTNGTITSTVSVNATAGFSVVTYTGTGANATVGHGLGVAPSMIIVKSRSQGGTATYSWAVWHSALAGTEYLLLNGTAAKATAATVWNSTVPTSSVFSLGTDSIANGNTVTYVAYCWAGIAGFSKFGSYTGNGSADGPFVYCGFRPRFVLIKSSSGLENWIIQDTSRDTYNQMNNVLIPNASNAETAYASSQGIDVLSNGFKLRVAGAPVNTSAGTYIYAAFAENPFANALAR